jgi:hypothetical protein
MPVECRLLEGKPVPIKECPKCGARPFTPFLRGEVQRAKTFVWRPRDYCALICSDCKELVGYESP